MKIDGVQTAALPGRSLPRARNFGSEIFTGLLKKSMQPRTPVVDSPSGRQYDDTKIILGKVSDLNPTVSHVLARHPEHGKNTWRIIYNEINQNKDFTRIPNGATITMDPATRELSWQSSDRAVALQADSISANPAADRSGPIQLGRVSDSQPTISHVLARHPEHGKNTWRIIYNEINKNKDFTRIPHGATITMDPATQELSWGMPTTVADQTAPVAYQTPRLMESDSFKREPDAFSQGLARAVRRHVGRPYDDVDCYTLIVQGLEEMGVDYRGKDGIHGKMVSLAREKGLAGNSYVTGEGLVEVAGSKVYSRQINQLRNPAAQARDVYQEMKPLLEPGLVLSFSTRSSGHTGIISQSKKQWTYINSGYIDNDISNRPPAKRVGEERLSAEIANWTALAARRREPLTISMGRLHDTSGQSEPLMAKADSTGVSG